MEQTFYPQLGESLHHTVLPNGLTVFVNRRPGFSRKLAYFITDFGSIHTEFTLDGRKITAPAGIAHFLEHKMFDLPGRDVTAEFAALGASPNAFTSYDVTAYYFTCTENFQNCLRLLLEFVSTPYFTEESVAKEQGIIGQEIGMHDDNPDTRSFEMLMEAMYESHPIRIPILGSRESIGTITPALLYDCHKAFYRPGHMMLCVVGDVDPLEVAAIAEQVLPQKDETQVTRQESWPEEMRPRCDSREGKMDVAMPMFQLGFKCEPLGLGEEAIFRETVGELAAEALFGESSPLYLRLYEEGVIDGSFGGGFETVDGMATLLMGGDSEQPQKVMDAILEQAAQIVKNGLDEKDFLRMKRSALGRRIRDLDSFDGTCFRLCAYHFSRFDYFRTPEVYRQVEVSHIQEFLARVVSRQRASLTVILPST